MPTAVVATFVPTDSALSATAEYLSENSVSLPPAFARAWPSAVLWRSACSSSLRASSSAAFVLAISRWTLS